jgi:hypothetical protein
MIMIRTFFVFLLLISISACTKTTFVRSAPDYSQSLSKAKIVLLLPPNIEVNQVDALNKKTRVYGYEDRLEEIIVDTLITKMHDKGYNVKSLSRVEIGTNKLSQHVVDTKDNSDEILKILYAGGAWKEDAAYSIDHKIPSAVDLGTKVSADLLVVMNFYAESKTSGAMTKDLSMNVLQGALSMMATGNAHVTTKTDPSEFAMIRLAILDAVTGRVLWAHSVSASNDMIGTTLDSFSNSDKVDKKKLSVLINSVLVDLPNR